MANKRKKDGGQRIDWIKIKADYVSDPNLSLKKLSQKYGIRKATIEKKSSADNWFATKKENLKSMSDTVSAKVSAKRADALAREIEIADKATSVLLKAFEDVDQWNRYIVNETMSEGATTMSTSNEKVFRKVDTRALKDAMQTLKMIEDLKRSMLNIQKAEQLNKDRREDRRLEIEEERLKMDQAKANLATGDEDNCGIMILPEVLSDEG